MTQATLATDVFINCPFDNDYRGFFHAIVFTVMRSGFRPRCALETDDSSENRIARIEAIIEECRYGIHDISRTEADGEPPLPRFNMPFELGLFLGAKRYGDSGQSGKRCMVLDREQFRYQRFLSDIAGQDIHSHAGGESTCVEKVANWLRTQSRNRKVPGGRKIAGEFEAFQTAFPAICQARGLHLDDVKFPDLVDLLAEYLTATA